MFAVAVPDWVSCMPNEKEKGAVSGRYFFIADTGQDFSRLWRISVKAMYGGMVASAFYCGAYDYALASVDLAQVEEMKTLYKLSEGDLLECWLEVHRDTLENWDLIMEMATELLEKELLGAEYFEEML